MMDWLKDKLRVQRRCRVHNAFEKIWHRHRRLNPSTLALVSRVAVNVRERIHEQKIECLVICRQIYDYVNGNISDVAPVVEENRLLLLEVVDIMATRRVDARAFFRETLTLLYQISKIVDREVYLFECSKDEAAELTDECRERMRYTLANIAGWKLTTSEPWLRAGRPPVEYYIDLPLRRVNSLATTHLMAEALFRLQDPEAILDVLRHGGTPSCIYLWPIIVMMDLKFVVRHSNAENENADAVTLAGESREARMISYFCRARRTVYVNPIRANELSTTRMPPNINYEDVLLIPRVMTFLVPEDRHKRPARLQHHCRLLIRQQLLAVDKLPGGIYQLPLPEVIQRYIDLLL